MEKEFSNEDSLMLIKQMVGISRQNLRESGIYYIMFGTLFFLAALLQYILYSTFESELHWLVWPGSGVFATVLGVLLGKKSRKAGGVKTYLSRLNRYLWIAFIIAIVFVAFLGSLEFISFTQINPLIIMLYGFATFIIGGMLKFRWLIIGAIAAWIIAVICTFMEYDVQMLLVSLTILVSYLIPGLILYYSKDKDA